jgi:uncharacterized tellurite resistance protein B-like protein
VEIHGIRISGGLIYVGRTLTQVRGYGIEPSLIDPSLPIQTFSPNEALPYWPSYSEISPAWRGAYLRWLEGGRLDPTVDVGLVFLFFYGLERRILAEKSQVAETEWLEIRAEIERLIRTYGQSRSFRNYASSFLGILCATSVNGESLPDNPPIILKSYESPNLQLKIGLGWMAKNAKPIPSNWALAWVKSHDQYVERTAAVRCDRELQRLFAIRYKEQFGEGVIVKPNKTPIKSVYRPASASFSDGVNLMIPELPDLTVLKHPIERLILLASQCTEELDAYSRYLGRNPGSEESASALALLPSALLHGRSHPALERIDSWVKGLQFQNRLAVATYQQMRAVWTALPATELSKRDAVTLSQCLDRLGYGIEPDIRFSSHQVKADGQIVLFPLPSNAPLAPTSQYKSSTLLAHLGAVMAHADDQVTPEEEDALMSHAAESLELTDSEKLRLQAYMKWLLTTPPETIGLKKRIDCLSTGQRSLLGSFLARLVGLDGQIAPNEITALQKVYRLLGLDPQSVFADAHAAATEPVSVQSAEPLAGFVIPSAKSSPVKARVDLARIRAMEIESEQVSVLLRDIFTNDEEAVIVASTIVDSAVIVKTKFLDLDEVHSRFALTLLERDRWNRIDLEALASTHGLMPEGALDAINEASLDLHGEPLLEGEDPVEVNIQLRSLIQP